MRKYLRIFQSVRFNIGLFAALALASVLGTLIPQAAESPEKVQAFVDHAPRIGWLLGKLGFFHIYYSWWFIGMLALMAFDVVVCKLIFGKFPGFKTFKNSELNAGAVGRQPLRGEWVSRRGSAEAAGRVEELLRRERYRTTMIPQPDGSFLIAAARHRLQRFGSWVSHVSILLILLANVTGLLYGFREVVNVPEGMSKALQHRPWTVACDRFTVDYYPNTRTPRTFASDLRLFEKGRLAKRQRILVNEPMEHRKVRFYQASYGPHLKSARVGMFLRNAPKKSPPAVTVKLDEDAPVPGTPYSLRILQFVPDLAVNEDRKVVSRSAHPDNPAVQILVSKNGKPVKAPWIFEKYPTLQMPPVQDSDDFILVLAEYVPSFYTGLQITYDPGADLFWLACGILVAGLCVLFYLHHRKVWVWVREDDATGRTLLSAGAFSSRGRSFEPNFMELLDKLKADA